MLQGDIWDYAVAALFGACGGIARALDVKDKRELSVFRLLSGVFISGFAGIMLYMILKETDLSSGWIGAAVGIAGWLGPRAIRMLGQLVGKKANLEIPLDDKTDNE